MVPGPSSEMMLLIVAMGTLRHTTRLANLLTKINGPCSRPRSMHHDQAGERRNSAKDKRVNKPRGDHHCLLPIF